MFSGFLPVRIMSTSVILATSSMMFLSWGAVTCEPSVQ